MNEVAFMELDTAHVQGKKIISRIYHPIGLKSDVSETVQANKALQHRALHCYYNCNFNEADDLFCRLIQQNTGCEDYYRYMLQQVAAKQNSTTVKPGEISLGRRFR